MHNDEQKQLERNRSIAKHQRASRKTSNGLKWLIVIVTIVLFVAGGYVLRLYGQTKRALDSTYHATGQETTKTEQIFNNSQSFSLLLLGADTGAEGRNDQGNSDTMILATLNPKTKKVTLTSVPRDTMAQIYVPGDSNFNVQKINAAYMLGGSKASLSTVSHLLNIPLTYYVTINMGGLEKIVNAVGGVNVEVPFNFSYDGSSFTKGKMHLNGKQALSYARMRHEDPEGDYGRQKRQRQIITSIIKSAASAATLTRFQKVLTSISSNITTNLTFNDMTNIFLNYHSAIKQVKSDHIQGVNAYIGQSAYVIAPTKELQRVSDAVRKELGLTSATLSNQEVRQNRLNAQNNNFIFENPTVVQTYYIYSQNSDSLLWNGSN